MIINVSTGRSVRFNFIWLYTKKNELLFTLLVDLSLSILVNYHLSLNSLLTHPLFEGKRLENRDLSRTSGGASTSAKVFKFASVNIIRNLRLRTLTIHAITMLPNTTPFKQIWIVLPRRFFKRSLEPHSFSISYGFVNIEIWNYSGQPRRGHKITKWIFSSIGLQNV